MMKRYQKTAISQYFIIGLILFAIIGLGLLSTIVMARISFEDQFIIPWAAGRGWLLEGENPYSSFASEKAQETLSESRYLAVLPENPQFKQPILSLLYYLVFSLIPYEISRAAWITLQAICIVLIGHFSLKLSGWKVPRISALGIIILSFVWFPGVYTLLLGELAPIIILLLLLGMDLLKNDQDTTAGFLFALISGSFVSIGIILILILIWSVSQKRWSVISAYFSGLAFLMVITVLMLPSWPLDLLAVLLRTYENWDWIKTPLMALTGVLPGIANFLSITFHAILGIFVLTQIISIWKKSGRVFIWKTLSIFVVAFILNVQASIEYLFLILPAAYLVFRFLSERWGFIGRLSSWMLMVIFTAGSWLLIYQDLDFTQSVSLPMLTIGFPLIVFLGLIWIRWWAFSIPKLYSLPDRNFKK